MKSILLASVASVAFAGAAAAEVSFGGDATVGYNTNDGFYWGSNLSVSMSQELDNGLTVSASIGIEIVSSNTSSLTLYATGWSLTLSSANASLSFGEFDNGVAYDAVDSVDGMAAGMYEVALGGDDELGIVGKATFGDFEVAVSGEAEEGNGFDDMEIAVSGNLGGMMFAAGMQDTWDGAAMGVSVGTTVGGADVTFAYASDDSEDSIGLGVSMPVGPVTVGFSYASNSVSDDAWGVSVDYAAGDLSLGMSFDSTEAWEITMGYAAGAVSVDGYFDSDNDMGVDVSYDMGNGLVLNGGFHDGADAAVYAGAEYDLGGGAALLVSYSDTGAEVGPEYSAGTTVEVSFSF